MTRRAAKTDRNQSEIVSALRRAGASVVPLHAVGMGCPDLLVGFRGTNHLMEVKDGDLPPSARALTSWQDQWHHTWEGQACVVTSPEEALAVLFEGAVT
jgi:hypothetical protein